MVIAHPKNGPDIADAIVNFADRNAHGRSNHRCLAYVRMALESQGVANAERAGQAIDSVRCFENNPHFTSMGKVSVNQLTSLPRGTVIITRNPRGGAGHAEIARGDGTAVSDFDQKGMVVYRGATEFWAFVPKGVTGGSHLLTDVMRTARPTDGVARYGRSSDKSSIPDLFFIFSSDTKSAVEDAASKMKEPASTKSQETESHENEKEGAHALVGAEKKKADTVMSTAAKHPQNLPPIHRQFEQVESASMKKLRDKSNDEMQKGLDEVASAVRKKEKKS